MIEKYKLPKSDSLGRRVHIERPTRIRVVLTGTCANSLFHAEGIWEFTDIDRETETISSVEQLREYVQGWDNEVRLAHKRTGCMTNPLVSVTAGEYVFKA